MIEVRLAKEDVLQAIESGEEEFVIQVDEAVPLSEVVELCVALRNAIEFADYCNSLLDGKHEWREDSPLDEPRALLAQWIDVPEKA